MTRRLTIEDLARACRVSIRTAARWRARGLPRERRAGRDWYDIREARAWLEAQGLSGRPGRPSDTDRLGAPAAAPAARQPAPPEGDPPERTPVSKEALAAAELRRRIALARKHVLDVAEREGRLADVDDFERFLVETVQEARRIFEAFPAMVARHGPEVVREAEAAVRRTLEALSRMFDSKKEGTDGLV